MTKIDHYGREVLAVCVTAKQQLTKQPVNCVGTVNACNQIDATRRLNMTLQELQALKDSGEFHHATYRNLRTLWEGLWIYKKDSTGFRGYRDCGAFLKDSPDLDAAHEIVRDTGINLGHFGAG